MFMKNAKSLLKRALSLLSTQDQVKIYIIAILQLGMALLDMLGIAIMGLVASISLFGIQSRKLPSVIIDILEIIQLDKQTFQMQVAVLGITAGFLLVGKTLFTAYLSRKILFFLNRKTALVTADLLGKVLLQPYDYIKSKSPAEYLFSLTRGVKSLISGVIGSTSLIFNEVALLTMVFIGLFIFDPVITIFSVLYFGLIGYLQSMRLTKLAEYSQSESAKALIKSENQILESFSLYKELHVRDSRRNQVAQLAINREKMADFSSRVMFMPYIAKYVMEVTLVFGGIALAATQFIVKDALTALTTLSVFLVSASRVSPSILRLQQGLIQFKASVGDSHRTLDLMMELEQLGEIPKLSKESELLSTESGGISVTSLVFRYQDGDTEAVREVSFEVPFCSTLALVGPSGNGKSTILDLLMGALKPQSGSVRIGGLSPTEFIARNPGQLGYVAQESIFANTSIKENLLLGLDTEKYPDEKIWEVLRRVGLESTLKELPGGLDSSLGERGMKLSSGQKQRLSIARALITNPKVLFLDEPTSSLDRDSEDLVTDLINSIKGKTTIVVIAHRLETIKSADQIAYIEAGSIKRIGTYEEIFGSKSYPSE